MGTANNIPPNSFVDSDVIIRLLTGDDPKKQAAAVKLFEKVEQGKLILTAPNTVIADVVYVLSSPRLYRLSKTTIREILHVLLGYPSFKIESKQAVVKALDFFADKNIDFGDALLASLTLASKEKTIYSYDHDFDKIPTLIRKEP